LIITFGESNFKAPEEVGVEVVHNTIFGDYGFTSGASNGMTRGESRYYLSDQAVELGIGKLLAESICIERI